MNLAPSYICKKTLKGHVLPLLFLITSSTILLRHSLINPMSSIGMSGGDTEGTMWWIWTNCKGYNSGSILTNISSPLGFDVSHLPVYNFVDQCRIWVTRLFGCSPASTIAVTALLPLISLITGSLAAYALGFQLFLSRRAGLFVAVSACFSSQVLLATRTSLANNVLTPGLVALVFVVIYLRKGSKTSLLVLLFATTIQVLCNVYNGALFGFLALVFVLFLPSSIVMKFRQRLWSCVAIMGAAILGLGPLLKSQFFLITNSVESNIYRPIDQFGETIDPLVLVSRNYDWFDSLAPSSWPRPEAGWISIVQLLVVVAFFFLLLTRRLVKSKEFQISVVCLATSIFLVVLVFKIPGTALIHNFYFNYFGPLRGVSNFAKGIPLLLGICGPAVSRILQESGSLPRLSLHKSGQSIKTSVFIAFIAVLMLDNIPRSQDFSTRTSLQPIGNFWKQVPRTTTGSTAHFPDFTYGKEWGFPLRFIQLSQIFMDSHLANGRDYQKRASICSALPTPIDLKSLKTLQNRGITQIILHRNLMIQNDFNAAYQFLAEIGFKHASYKSPVSSQVSEFTRSLDVIVFVLPTRVITPNSC